MSEKLPPHTVEQLEAEIETLRARIADLEAQLGEIATVVVTTPREPVRSGNFRPTATTSLCVGALLHAGTLALAALAPRR